MPHMSLSVAVAALGLMMLTGPMDGTQATERGRAYVARHHAGVHAARRACYAARHHAGVHATRRTCYFTGGYSRLTVRDVLWGPAGMPPAPKDFGPHFDFPPASLNNGPTEAPYPGW
jgi:hypothetical protein